jgi:hypothetical protein
VKDAQKQLCETMRNSNDAPTQEALQVAIMIEGGKFETAKEAAEQGRTGYSGQCPRCKSPDICID